MLIYKGAFEDVEQSNIAVGGAKGEWRVR